MSKFDLSNMGQRARELLAAGDPVAVEALRNSLDGKVVPAQLDGNADVAGTPGFQPGRPKSPGEQGVAGHLDGPKEHDLKTRSGLRDALAAGEIDSAQYRKRLRELKAAEAAAAAEAEDGDEDDEAEAAENEDSDSDSDDDDDEADEPGADDDEDEPPARRRAAQFDRQVIGTMQSIDVDPHTKQARTARYRAMREAGFSAEVAREVLS